MPSASKELDLAESGYNDRYEQALRLAARAHRPQDRKGSGVPYITHPVHVSLILRHYGFPAEVTIAGLLHDIVEDQGYPLSEIEAQFGARVAAIVDAMSEHKTDGQGEARSWEARKREAIAQLRRAGVDAVAVKAADTLHNARSIAMDLRQEGRAVWRRFKRGPDRMLGYYEKIVLLAREWLGGHPLVDELARAVDDLAHLAEDE
jgi:(p)ppGpp synthase/HD superfamily hydrolase